MLASILKICYPQLFQLEMEKLKREAEEPDLGRHERIQTLGFEKSRASSKPIALGIQE